MVNNLIEEIKKLQELKGLKSDKDLAAAIGIDAGHWSKIKRGLAQPGGRFLKAIVEKYPELELAVHHYMISGREKAAV